MVAITYHLDITLQNNGNKICNYIHNKYIYTSKVIKIKPLSIHETVLLYVLTTYQILLLKHSYILKSLNDNILSTDDD